MDENEIRAVVELRNTGLQFSDIALKLGLSIDSVKRRWYAHKNRQTDLYKKPFITPVVNAIPFKIDPVPQGANFLFFDIETAPILGYTWQMYDTSVLRIVRDSYLLSFSYKWAHEQDFHVHALPEFPAWKKDRTDDSELSAKLWDIIDRAHIVCGHNAKQFDIKKANARFAKHDLGTPSSYKVIDTLTVARKQFKMSSNKLNDLAEYFGIGRKLPNTGMDLWMSCMQGDDPQAWETMKKYNEHDVWLLEEVYHKLQPWDKTHPNMTLYSDDQEPACPKCQSKHFERRGYEYKANSKVERFRCNDCTGYFTLGGAVKKTKPVLVES